MLSASTYTWIVACEFPKKDRIPHQPLVHGKSPKQKKNLTCSNGAREFLETAQLYSKRFCYGLNIWAEDNGKPGKKSFMGIGHPMATCHTSCIYYFCKPSSKNDIM
jgi:hypothetical protein